MFACVAGPAVLGRSLQGFSVASRASGSALSSISAVRTCLCALAYRIYHLPMDSESVSDVPDYDKV